LAGMTARAAATICRGGGEGSKLPRAGSADGSSSANRRRDIKGRVISMRGTDE
jgi:hypothetical protein